MHWGKCAKLEFLQELMLKKHSNLSVILDTFTSLLYIVYSLFYIGVVLFELNFKEHFVPALLSIWKRF